jgi:hypothetical protein
MTAHPPAVPEEIARILRRVTRDFAASDDRDGFTAGTTAYGIDVRRSAVPEPAVLLYLLRDVLGFVSIGRFEKVAWVCVFSFRGIAASIADENFGVRLYLDRSAFADRREARQTAAELVRALERALKVLERRFLTSYAAGQLNTDQVTAMNQSARLREMYEYFREGAEAAYEGTGRLREKGSDKGIRILHKETEGFFNTVSMSMAYFSWLEHALLLAIAFNDATRIPVADFMRLRWGQKYLALLPVKNDARSLRVYRRLRRVSDEYRNPYAHGALHLRQGAFAFHLPGCGAVSMGLRQDRLTPSFWLVPFDRRAFDDAARTFAATDRLLREHRRTRTAMAWIDGGLPVAFDLQSRAAYARAATSARSFDDFLERSVYEYDQSVNMDW